MCVFMYVYVCVFFVVLGRAVAGSQGSRQEPQHSAAAQSSLAANVPTTTSSSTTTAATVDASMRQQQQQTLSSCGSTEPVPTACSTPLLGLLARWGMENGIDDFYTLFAVEDESVTCKFPVSDTAPCNETFVASAAASFVDFVKHFVAEHVEEEDQLGILCEKFFFKFFLYQTMHNEHVALFF